MNNSTLAASDWVVPNNLNLNPGNDDKGYFSFLSGQSLNETGVNFSADMLNGDFGSGQLSADFTAISDNMDAVMNSEGPLLASMQSSLGSEDELTQNNGNVSSTMSRSGTLQHSNGSIAASLSHQYLSSGGGGGGMQAMHTQSQDPIMTGMSHQSLGNMLPSLPNFSMPNNNGSGINIGANAAVSNLSANSIPKGSNHQQQQHQHHQQQQQQQIMSANTTNDYPPVHIPQMMQQHHHQQQQLHQQQQQQLQQQISSQQQIQTQQQQQHQQPQQQQQQQQQLQSHHQHIQLQKQQLQQQQHIQMQFQQQQQQQPIQMQMAGQGINPQLHNQNQSQSQQPMLSYSQSMGYMSQGGGHMNHSGTYGGVPPSHGPVPAGYQHISRQPKEWHHPTDHANSRKQMSEEIIKLLKNRRPTASDDWHEKLPNMAKRLEDSLYLEANTLDEYMDPNTLKSRLQQLAMTMSHNPSQKPNSNSNPNPNPNPPNRDQRMMAMAPGQINGQLPSVPLSLQQGSQLAPHGGVNISRAYPQQMSTQPYGASGGSQQQYPARTAIAAASQYANMPQPILSNPSVSQMNMYPPNGNEFNQPQQMQRSQPNLMPAVDNRNVYNNGNIDNGGMLINNNMAPNQRGFPQPASIIQPSNAYLGHDTSGDMFGSQNLQQQQQQSLQSQHLIQQLTIGPHSMGMQAFPGQSSHQGNEEHRKQVLKQQQQRLLLLRHASKCPHDRGCPVTPHCSSMKELWRHIMTCKNQDCKTPHCVSSRYVLSHYSKCKEFNCPVCGPVRDAIKRNYLKSQAVLDSVKGPTMMPLHQVNQQNMQQITNDMSISQPNMAFPSVPGISNIGQPNMGTGGINMAITNGNNGFNQARVDPDQPPLKKQKKPPTGGEKKKPKTPKNPEGGNTDIAGGEASKPANTGAVKPKVPSESKDGKKKVSKPKKAGGDDSGVGEDQHQQQGIIGSDGTVQEVQMHRHQQQQQIEMERQQREREQRLKDQQAPVVPKVKSIYPLDPISCAIYSFTDEEVKSHISNIQEGLQLNATKIKEMCKPILQEIYNWPHAASVFGTPVDPVALSLPDYFQVIKTPMDLGTVSKRLDGGSYRDLHYFVSDVHLTFDNAMHYNPKSSDVYLLAKSLKREFDIKFKQKRTEFEKMIEEMRRNKNACLICGEEHLKFEPPVYYCNGPCSQKIRRGAWFYSNDANTYHWCSPCYGNLKDSQPIRLPENSIAKSDLKKKRHTDESEEGWVQCEGGCDERWVHQVCCLFNSRRNTGEEVAYVCPCCLQDKRKKCPDQVIVAPTSKKMKASDLPYSTMSKFLEDRIFRRLDIAYEEEAERLGIPLGDVEKCPPLILRQVSCLDKAHQVREGVLERYKDKGYPSEFPCRTKCILLFQTIDGQDVLLFGMYVYEYGHSCPQPNQRRVYISYLDSVHFLRPKQYRTLVYHEILVSYLDYVKARGFHTAHIWACPPQKGDDYIMYVHPPDQKTPKPQILRVWYDDMLKIGKERGVVHDVVDIHTEYLCDYSNDATVLPYFEGDYWVNEAEVIIKDLKSGKGPKEILITDDNVADVNNEQDITNKKSKRRTKAKVRVARNTSVGGPGGRERDPVMFKLANIIEPMKDTFFVARLHPREYAEKHALKRASEVNAETSTAASSNEGADTTASAPDGDNYAFNLSRSAEAAAKENNGITSTTDSAENPVKEPATVDSGASSSSSASEGAMDVVEKVGDSSLAESKEPEGPEVISTAALVSHGVAESKENDESVGSDTTTANTSLETSASTVAVAAASSSGEKTANKRLIWCGEGMPTFNDDTEDVDDVQECEHFDTRQSFLNLCQGNHYQFDQLRRAKHSSMMVLYHLHNPDAPKFVHNCNACHTDILTGTRYHCENCDIDFCHGCVLSAGKAIHSCTLRPITLANTVPTQLTEEQRKERQRSILLHMQLLQHSANCVECKSKNCMKMKEFLKHDQTCKIKSMGGCRLCLRISNLLTIHARKCKQDTCKVPHCLEMKEQFRKLALRQQQMDDRRRMNMNSEYNRTGPDNSKAETENNDDD